MKKTQILTLFLAVASARAEDWPMYMHDPARSGVSGEALSLPLAELWSYVPPAPLPRAWPDPQPNSYEQPKITFDEATHVALAGDALFFGSPVDNAIHARDAATGTERWTFFTDGPVRLAPAFARIGDGPATSAVGRIFAGSDDGAVYCLDAADGRIAWRARLFTGSDRIIGAGRLMSLWPVRTDILVDGGVAYCGAGLFPVPGTALVALDAATGKSSWRFTKAPKGVRMLPPMPEGYLVASRENLYVPRGRAAPQVFKRSDGSPREVLQQEVEITKAKGVISGDYGVLIDDLYYLGTQNVLHSYKPDGKHVGYLKDVRQIIAAGGDYFRLQYRPRRGTQDSSTVVAAIDRAAVDGGQPKEKQPVKAVKWTYVGQNFDKIIAAGPHVFVGGSNTVIALDAATGKELWRGAVDGAAKGLAAANGRLVVSTDRGRIHVFGKGAPVPRVAPAAEPFPAAGGKRARLAEDIVKDAGMERGFALIVGGGADGAPLAYEIAKRSGMLVHVLESDPSRADKSRAMLAAAGAYGSKVVVDLMRQGDTNGLPYPPYFANIVLADAGQIGPGGAGSKALLRILKPCGGRLYLGPLDGAPAAQQVFDVVWRKGGTLSEGLAFGGIPGWTRLVRANLPGAGEWTHQFADAGNSGSSDDALVKPDLDVLWYGEPGPDKMQDRHTGTQSPLFVDGRMYAQGWRAFDKIHLVMCFDAYNGIPYWERPVPGAERVEVGNNCGNLAASTAGLFVATGDKCLHLDPLTGATRRSFNLPPRSEGTDGKWAYVAVVGDLLVGSSSPSYAFSDEVFAYDINSGILKWRHRAPVIRNATLAVSGGRMFFAEHRGELKPPKVPTRAEKIASTQAQRRGETKPAPAKPKVEKTAVAEGDEGAEEPDGDDAAQPPAPPPAKDYLRTAVALDLATGKELWSKKVDLTDCGSWAGSLNAAAKGDVLVFFGIYTAYGRAKGDEEKRRALALSAVDGSLLWNKPIGNYVRPVLIGDRLVSRPKAFYLKTGEPVMRKLKDGRMTPWTIGRLGACGQMTASAAMLFYRLGSTYMVDIDSGRATGFMGVRPGCLINMIPAGGLAVQVEASSGCVCPHAAVQATVVLAPRGAE